MSGQPARPRRPSARVPDRPARVPPSSLVPPPIDEAITADTLQVHEALERLARELARTRRTLDAIVEQIGAATDAGQNPEAAGVEPEGRCPQPELPEALADHLTILRPPQDPVD